MSDTQSDRCLATLVKDSKALSYNQATTYAFVQLINQQLSSAQRDAIGAAIPIGNVSLGLNSSQAMDITTDFFKQTGLQWSQDTSLQMVSSTLSPEAVEAYRICVEGEHVSGPRIWAFDATPSQVTVKIRWIAPVEAPTTASLMVNQSGGTPRAVWPISWKTGEDHIVIYDRTAGQDLRVAANIGGEADSIVVPYIPSIKVTPVRTPVSKGPYKLETDELGHNQGPLESCEVPTIGGLIDPGSANIRIDTWAGPLDTTSYAKITSKDERRVCWEAFLRPLEAHHGGILVFYVTYDVITLNFKALP